MSQEIGLNFKVRIPTFSDDASIEEALKVYHYGVDNYTSQTIPNNSIEGHFLTLTNRVAATEFSISQLFQSFIEEVSSASDPNEITPETSSVIPLNIKGVVNQIAPLQRWQGSVTGPTSVVTLASIFPNGGASFANYLSVGNSAQVTTTALDVTIGNASHQGIVVRASSGQSANMQEWRDSAGTSILARVSNTGTLFSNNIQVVTLSQTQTLTNKTLTSPTITTPTITNGTISNASSITLSGTQDNSSRVRNITFSTGDPSGGNDGDIWIKYV